MWARASRVDRCCESPVGTTTRAVTRRACSISPQWWGGSSHDRARAVAGHANAHEAFAPFAAAVIVNHLAGGDLRVASILSIGFVVCRVAYHVAYLLDVDYLRTLVWFLGLACTIGLFVQPLL